MKLPRASTEIGKLKKEIENLKVSDCICRIYKNKSFL